MGTRTASFGAGRREGHDASAFYGRFTPPILSDDDVVRPSGAVPEGAIVGDARDMRDLPDACVALVVTSPPYFAGKAYEEALGQGGVPATYLEFLAMLRDVFAECRRVLEPGGRIAVNVANLGRKPYRSLAADVIAILQDDLGMLLRGEVVWVKGEGASGSCAWGSFRSAANPVLRDVTERIVIASKGRFDRALPAPARRREGLPSDSTISTDEFLEATLDVWRFAPEKARRVNHPAPFPVELPERLIQLYTYEGDLVLDPFAGSGSTLVAAARTGRRGVGYDTDPAYVDIAVARVREEGRPGAAHTQVAAARGAAKPIAGIAEDVLTAAGFTIEDRTWRPRGVGLTVDLVVGDRAGGRWCVDVTGGFTTVAGGLSRTDVVWRTLGRASAVRANELGPLLLLTSQLPARGSEADLALRAAGRGAFFDAVEVLGEGRSRLATYAARGPGAGPLPGFWAPA